ncbi:MAG: chromo domain-containing protein, partial [Gloeomargaritales cyanobacterium]
MEAKNNLSSIRGYRYVAVFVCKRSRFTKVYPLKTRDASVDALRDFLTDVGSPMKLCFDRAGEFVLDEEFKNELRKNKIQSWTSEAYHQHQNRAEPRIRDVKANIHKILGHSGAPPKYWCYAAELAESLLNLTAIKSLQWRTPWELCFGDTPDISALYQFKFYDKIRYTTPGIQFPKNRDLPGRYLGPSWNVGDLLTYKIEPDDNNKKTNRHILIHRSAVGKDTGVDKRLSSARKQEDQDSPTNNKKQESIQESIFEKDADEDYYNSFHKPYEEKEIPSPENINSEELINYVNDDVDSDTSSCKNIDREDNFNDLADALANEIEHDGDDLFEVDTLLSHRVTGTRKKKPELLVLWKAGDESWEPLDILRKDVPHLVANYIIKHKLKRPFYPKWALDIQKKTRRLLYVLRRRRQTTAKSAIK